VSQNSLSLFETAEEAVPRTASPVVGHSDTRDRQQRHLQAARRLSRRIARLPDHSPEQLRAGQMICRHLVAMLEEAAAESESTPH
jgi:hypothetical protein